MDQCIAKMFAVRGIHEKSAYRYHVISESVKKADVNKALKPFLDNASSDGLPSIAIIANDCSVSKKVREGITESHPNVEFFTVQELMCDPLSHAYAPSSVRVLTSQEKEQFLQDMSVRFENLPLILSNDPLSRYLGVKVGQVMEIVRSCPPGPTYYRRVV